MRTIVAQSDRGPQSLLEDLLGLRVRSHSITHTKYEQVQAQNDTTKWTYPIIFFIYAHRTGQTRLVVHVRVDCPVRAV